jgi:spore coat protein U-like protein
LQYNLYTTPSLNVVWGDGTAGTSTIRLKNVKRQKPPVVTKIYGRIPARQDVRAGAYRDTLTVTITW